MRSLLTLIGLALVVHCAPLGAQEVSHVLEFTDGVNTRDLSFGLDPSATDGLDFPLEIEFPPLPPGLLEVLFIGEDIGLGMTFGYGTMADYRNGDSTFSGTVQHEVKLRLGAGPAITVSWDLPPEITGVITDVDTGGGLVDEPIAGTGSYTFPTTVQRAIFTITYALGSPGPQFVRGDCNVDGAFNIADAVFGLAVLFQGGGPAACTDACDANDDGAFDIGDMISLLNALFVTSTPLPAPYPTCGADPTADALDCGSFSACP